MVKVNTNSDQSYGQCVASIRCDANGALSLLSKGLTRAFFKFRSDCFGGRNISLSPSAALEVTLLPPAYTYLLTPTQWVSPIIRRIGLLIEKKRNLLQERTPNLTTGSPLRSLPWKGSPLLCLDFKALQILLLLSLPPSPTCLTL